ncbi:MAG: DUF499 domain-containing protein, partial [Crenarchaeota archaeon]|nr:DUF499 domain-containing protein [Thermoproteota archaeon]
MERAGWRPFEEVARGKITDSSFAVNLWYVHKGCPGVRKDCVDERYRDPKKFFDRTYFSEGLRQVLSDVLRRLVYGGDYNAVVLLYTTFGGGKSHTLLSLYHLAKNFKRSAESRRLRRFLEEIGVDPEAEFPSAVAVFDGAAVDPVRLRRVYEAPNVWTFVLRELANASGDSELLREVERYKSVPPGHETMAEILARMESRGIRPVILMDEIALYVRNLEVKGDERAYREIQGLRTFLHSLAVAVASSKYAVLAVATPQQYEEISQNILSIFSDVKRVAMPSNVVGHKDASEVLKAALLEHVSSDAASLVSEEYMNMYKEEKDKFPVSVVISDFRKRLADSYPFHPFLVDVLYDELSTVHGFQGTRDVLRITAWSLYWRYRSGDLYDFLLLGDLDATKQQILNEMLTRNEYLKNLRNAISSDISVLEEMDEIFAQKGLPRVASSVYSAVLVRSAANKASRSEEVLLGTASPLRGVTTHLVLQTLEDLPERTAHFHKIIRGDEVLYMVKANANVHMLVRRLAAETLAKDREAVKEKLRKELNNIIKTTHEAKIVVWPLHPGHVEDSPRIKVVLFDPDRLSTSSVREEVLETLNRFTMYSQAGAGASFRTHKNTVVYLVPERRIYDKLLEYIARLIAVDSLSRPEQKNHYGLEKEDLDELNRIREKTFNDVRSALAALYVKLYYPIGVRSNKIEFGDTQIEPSSVSRGGIWRAVKEQLKALNKLAEDVASEYVLYIITQRYEAMRRRLTIEDVVTAFTGNPEAVMLIDAENVIKEKIKRLVEEGKLVL